MTDVAIIGGGAAGLCTAVMLKGLNKDIDVTVFEGNDRVGKKLSITGNGRCNISNKNVTADDFHGDKEFAWNIVSGFNYEAQKSFFLKIGVPFIEENDGKAYPRSLQAASVVDALRFRAAELGVTVKTATRVKSILRQNEVFTVLYGDTNETFKTVVVACGGAVGGKYGNDDGFAFLKSFGHKIEKTFPAIVQLKTDRDVVKQLKGIKVDAVVTAVSDSGTRVESGEVLFCDYGLSGPPILQVSRLAEQGNMTVHLDFCPDMTTQEITEYIINAVKSFSLRPIGELLCGFINKRLGQVVLKSCGLELNMNSSTIADKDAEKVAKALKKMPFKVMGTTGFENAQVTAGGAQTAQFFDNCMSKKAKGLFAVGEVLNVDGDCGGYNLCFAWSSSNACANGIVEYLKKQGSK